MLKRTFLLVLAGSLVLISGAAAKTLKVLGVGNSFTMDASHHLKKVVESSGNKIEYMQAVIGGGSLRMHLDGIEAYEKDPSSPEGKPYKIPSGRVSLKEMLKKNDWDIVTIQQVSTDSFKIETFKPDMKILYDYIKKHCPKAEVILHRTWAYPKDEGDEMHNGIIETYDKMAKELKCRIIPSGDLFFEIKKDETLKKKLYRDSKHAGPSGRYALACLWLEVLYGESCLNISYNGEVGGPENAKKIKEIAHKTAENVKEKNKQYLSSK